MYLFELISAALEGKVPLTFSLGAYILLGCLILRWIANILANHIPASMIHDWEEEVAAERDEAFVKPRPSLLKAIRETPKVPSCLRSLQTGAPVDWTQAGADIALALFPLIAFLLAGGITVKSALIAFLTFPCALAIIIDKNHFLLPDVITLPTLWLGLLANSQTIFTSPAAAILGAAFGYGIIWGVNRVYRLLNGEDGIGLGDAKWLAIPGAWFGAMSAIHALLIASVVAIIYALTTKSQKIPFGPALSLATIIVGAIALGA
jgi:leader peptidase (prepilin peptidase)/N-methyltransferase